MMKRDYPASNKRSRTKMPVNGRTPSYTNLKKLPLLREVPSNFRTELFIQKCQVCERYYNLHPETQSLSVSEVLLGDDTKRRKSQIDMVVLRFYLYQCKKVESPIFKKI